MRDLEFEISLSSIEMFTTRPKNEREKGKQVSKNATRVI